MKIIKMSNKMNTKVIMSIAAITILLSIQVTNSYAQIPPKPEYAKYNLECGLNLQVDPEMYLANLAQQYNYNLDSMPKSTYDAYVCVNWVHINEGGDKLISKLGDAMMRDHNNDNDNDKEDD